MSKLYLISFDMQEKAISQHCYGDCGKAVVGAIEIYNMAFIPCREDDCPYLVAQMDEPVYSNDDDYYIRKIQESEDK